jgi:Fe-S cluster biogenesis protein NfuA
MSKQKEVETQIESIDKMVRALEECADPLLRTNAQELVQALMALHGACLERMLEVVGQSGVAGKTIVDSFVRDEVVKNVLLLYGLHPVELRTRVLEALEKARPILRLHGGNVTFVDLDEAGKLTLRLESKSDSCQSTSANLKQCVEQVVYEAAPDVTAIVLEGFVEKQAGTAGFVPLASLTTGSQHALQESS